MTLFYDTRNDIGPAAGTDDPYRINAKIQWICSMSAVRGPPSVPVADNPDSPPPRDFAFTLLLHREPHMLDPGYEQYGE